MCGHVEIYQNIAQYINDTMAHHIQNHGFSYVLCYTLSLDKKTPNFAQGLDFLRFQVAIYTVFHEESEAEVKKCQNLEPGGKE